MRYYNRRQVDVIYTYSFTHTHTNIYMQKKNCVYVKYKISRHINKSKPIKIPKAKVERQIV